VSEEVSMCRDEGEILGEIVESYILDQAFNLGKLWLTNLDNN
jgi:hypothetical protein